MRFNSITVSVVSRTHRDRERKRGKLHLARYEMRQLPHSLINWIGLGRTHRSRGPTTFSSTSSLLPSSCFLYLVALRSHQRVTDGWDACERRLACSNRRRDVREPNRRAENNERERERERTGSLPLLITFRGLRLIPVLRLLPVARSPVRLPRFHSNLPWISHRRASPSTTR